MSQKPSSLSNFFHLRSNESISKRTEWTVGDGIREVLQISLSTPSSLLSDSNGYRVWQKNTKLPVLSFAVFRQRLQLSSFWLGAQKENYTKKSSKSRKKRLLPEVNRVGFFEKWDGQILDNISKQCCCFHYYYYYYYYYKVMWPVGVSIWLILIMGTKVKWKCYFGRDNKKNIV